MEIFLPFRYCSRSFFLARSIDVVKAKFLGQRTHLRKIEKRLEVGHIWSKQNGSDTKIYFSLRP